MDGKWNRHQQEKSDAQNQYVCYCFDRNLRRRVGFREHTTCCSPDVGRNRSIADADDDRRKEAADGALCRLHFRIRLKAHALAVAHLVFGGRHEHVAHTTYRADRVRVCRIKFDLTA
jgi:hypothetical protein